MIIKHIIFQIVKGRDDGKAWVEIEIIYENGAKTYKRVRATKCIWLDFSQHIAVKKSVPTLRGTGRLAG